MNVFIELKVLYLLRFSAPSALLILLLALLVLARKQRRISKFSGDVFFKSFMSISTRALEIDFSIKASSTDTFSFGAKEPTPLWFHFAPSSLLFRPVSAS
jgi:hypothetical protein